MQTQGGPAERPPPPACQFPPSLAALFSKAEDCALGHYLVYSTTRSEGAGVFHWALGVFYTCAFKWYFAYSCKVLHLLQLCHGMHTPPPPTPSPGSAIATRGHLKDTRSMCSRWLATRQASPACVTHCDKWFYPSAPSSFCLSAVVLEFSGGLWAAD